MASGASGVLKERQILTVIAMERFHGIGGTVAIIGNARQCALFRRAAERDNDDR
jgi:hypothetical protein